MDYTTATIVSRQFIFDDVIDWSINVVKHNNDIALYCVVSIQSTLVYMLTVCSDWGH